MRSANAHPFRTHFTTDTPTVRSGIFQPQRHGMKGGYEPGVSPFTPAVHKDVREAVLGYLQGELHPGIRTEE